VLLILKEMSSLKGTVIYKYPIIILLIGIFIQLFPVTAYASADTLTWDVKSVIADGSSNSFVVTYIHGSSIDNNTVKFNFGTTLAINTLDQYSVDGGSTIIYLNSSQISGGTITISGYSGTGSIILYLNNKTYATGGVHQVVTISYGTNNTSIGQKSLWAVKGYSAPSGGKSEQSFNVSPSALTGGSSGNTITLTFLCGYGIGTGPLTSGANGALLKFNLPAGITALGTDTVEFFNSSSNGSINTSQGEQTLTSAGAVFSGNSVVLYYPAGNTINWDTPVIVRLKNKTAPTSGPLTFSVQVDQDGNQALGVDLFEYSLASNNTYSMPLATATLPGSMVLYSDYVNNIVVTGFVQGTTLSDFAVSYTPGEALANGTVVFTIPSALSGYQFQGYFGPATRNGGHGAYNGSTSIWGLNSEYKATLVQSGNTFTLRGVFTNKGDIVELEARNLVTAPAAGTYNFSITADADGDGVIVPPSGYSFSTDGSTRYPSTATNASITSSTQSIYQLSYNGSTSGEYYVAKSAGSITLTITRTGNTNSTTNVGYQTYDGTDGLNGTGSHGALSAPGWDFTTIYSALSPLTMTFNPGDTSKTFTITINPNWAEGETHQDEYFTAWLVSPSNSGTLGTYSSYAQRANINITQYTLPSLITAVTNSTGNIITLSFDKTMYDQSGTESDFGVIVNGTADTVTAASLNADPTKIDLTLATPVTFGQIATVSYMQSNPYVKSDAPELEPLLSFTNQAVTNNLPSPTPVVGLSATTYSVKESDGNLAVVVNRTGPTAQAITVDYATTDSTAIAGKNYVACSGTLSFATGETSKTINIKINDDGLKVKNNTFNLTLSNPVGASLATTSSAIVTIIDTTAGPDPVVPPTLPVEPSGTLQFSLASYSGYEGQNVGVTITRTGGSNGVVGVSWSVDGSSTAVSGTDYSPDTTNTSPLSFADGETSKTLTFVINADTTNSIVRAGKTIVLNLSKPTGNGALGTQTSTTITLSDYIPSKNTVKTLTALNPTIALNPGDSGEGLLSVTLSNGAGFNLDSGDSGITWRPASTKIATVSGGVITAVGFGSTKVTTTYGGKTATFTVDTALQALSGIDSYGITIPEAKAGATIPALKLNLNSTDTILLTATNVNSVQAYVYSGMTWTTSSSKVATVDNSGEITTTGTPGTATITGTYGGKKVTAKINSALTGLTLSYPISSTPVVIFTPSSTATKPAELDMKFGDVSAPLVLTTTLATSALKDVASDSSTKWTTSNSKVATVNGTGVITTTSLPGTATITGTYGGKSAKLMVNTKLTNLVLSYPTDSSTPTAIFTVAPSTSKPAVLGMKPGVVSAPLILTVSYTNGTTGNVAADGSTVWTTSNSKVAAVIAGAITATSTPGTSTITAKYGGKLVSITVNTKLTLTLSDPSVTLAVEGTKTPTVTANYADGTTEDVTSKAVWTSSKNKVATVSSGQITGVKAGTATISVTYFGVKKSIAVSVSI